MSDPCGVMAGNFEDMSPEEKHAALFAALKKGESAGTNCEHELKESGIGKPTPADKGRDSDAVANERWE